MGRLSEKNTQRFVALSEALFMKKAFLPLTLLSLCASCAGPKDEDTSDNLDRTVTLQGLDADGDGIRDDIQRYIDVHYSDKRQIRALHQHVRALQRGLLLEEGDIAAAKAATIEVSHAIHCIYSVFPVGDAARESQRIESLVTNTKIRLIAHLNVSKTLDGTTWTLPSGDTCK